MTDDIVSRLRDQDILCDEAADEIEQLLEEIQQLKHDSTIFINERSDAICENFDLREENAELRDEIERLRAALERIAQHDMQAIAMDALRPGARIRPAKEASDDAAT